ncbi:carbohydrate ABC transporter permease [bacterium]|nr:carbohydrate ABC transporter permease [bacterium]MBU4361118.1 carbohydrate ABC transporter permease [bacterium]MBU4601538.1 carbohydrate ABC transporter permease [bacterium]MCG2821657.1 carbohydrate ABC transporter permease [Candidatus Atribacteria bacterium]
MHYQDRNITIAFSFIKYGILLFFAVVCLFPALWILISSFKTNQTILASALSLPTTLHWENYVSAMQVTGLPRAFLNSIIVSTLAVVLNAIVALLAAYVLARFKFRLNTALTIMFSLGILVPINSAVVPIKFIMLNLMLDNSLIGLIVLYAALGLPVSILILKSFLLSIPVQLEEAARIDGAGYWKIFFAVIFPLSQSGLVTVMILQFIFCWNEFLFATLLISTETKRTLQIAIKFFIGQFFFDYGGLFAAMVISIIPAIIVFILFQKKVISGLTAGAIKG